MRAQRLKKIQVGDTGSIRTPIALRPGPSPTPRPLAWRVCWAGVSPSFAGSTARRHWAGPFDDTLQHISDQIPDQGHVLPDKLLFIPRILFMANISMDSCHIAALGYIIA
jgi:hypothetical protein